MTIDDEEVNDALLELYYKEVGNIFFSCFEIYDFISIFHWSPLLTG